MTRMTRKQFDNRIAAARMFVLNEEVDEGEQTLQDAAEEAADMLLQEPEVEEFSKKHFRTENRRKLKSHIASLITN